MPATTTLHEKHLLSPTPHTLGTQACDKLWIPRTHPATRSNDPPTQAWDELSIGTNKPGTQLLPKQPISNHPPTQACDELSIGTHKPGTQLFPPPRGAEPRIHFIVEGECVVRRRAGGGDARRPSAIVDAVAAASGGVRHTLYDADTLCMLCAPDVFGLAPGEDGAAAGGSVANAGPPWSVNAASVNAGPPWSVSALGKVRTYSMPVARMGVLPAGMQAAIRDACSFKVRAASCCSTNRLPPGFGFPGRPS